MHKKFKSTLKKKLQMLSYILSAETKETKKMLETYLKHTSKGGASKEELGQANFQFKMILKAAGLGIFLILPLAPITFPLIIYLGKKLNVEILPKSYHEALEIQKKENERQP